MRKSNRKGFTIVELVIVIAVIAILAAVLIPTFASIVQKANDSNVQQVLAAARKVAIAENATDATFSESSLVYVYEEDQYTWNATSGKFEKTDDADKITVDAGDIVYAAEKPTGDYAPVNDADFKANPDLKAVIVIKNVADPAPTETADPDATPEA